MWADHGMTPYGIMPAVKWLMKKLKFRNFEAKTNFQCDICKCSKVILTSKYIYIYIYIHIYMGNFRSTEQGENFKSSETWLNLLKIMKKKTAVTALPECFLKEN